VTWWNLTELVEWQLNKKQLVKKYVYVSSAMGKSRMILK